MATSLETPSPAASLIKESNVFDVSPPLLSPRSDKRFWSNLRCRVDQLLENRQKTPNPHQNAQFNEGKSDRICRLKEDSELLQRGFDSVTQTLSRLSNNLDNAIQGARDLAKPPTITEIFHSNLKSLENNQEISDEEEQEKVTAKRKLDASDSLENHADEQNPREKKLKKATNIAISMAAKATKMERELKSLKSDLCFMQERCVLLEQENQRLANGPEEDDLVRLQLEALLAEKSRLANENANLVRENQCLHQLVEYHQLTSDDYDHVLQGGMRLNFSDDYDNDTATTTPRRIPNVLEVSTSVEDSFHDEQLVN